MQIPMTENPNKSGSVTWYITVMEKEKHCIVQILNDNTRKEVYTM